MVTAVEQARGDRVKAGVIVAVIHAGLGAALLFGLAGQGTRLMEPVTRLFDLAPPRPPPPPAPIAHHLARRTGAAAPRNLRAKATDVVVPPPKVPLVVPPPIVAAPVAGLGAASHAGASDLPGPGSGSGGRGTGSGSGGAGDGDGGDSPPIQIGKALSNDDYPRDLGSAGVGGTVGVRYRVDADGRARDCAVTDSSGSAALDALTCRLIERRFRFQPSRTADGRPVSSVVVESHDWEVDNRAADRER